MNDIQLHLGDCLEVMKDIPDGSVDCVITDIPYGEVNREDSGLRDLDRGKADDCEFNLTTLSSEFSRIATQSVYIFCGIDQVSELRKTLKENDMSTRLCIWEKTNPSPMNGDKLWLSGIECCVFGRKTKSTFNYICKNTVWKYKTEPKSYHPTAKPVELMAYIIEASSNIGDTIIDPFMGSGTTGVACIQTGRKFIGIEKDETYFNIAKQRIESSQLPLL